MLLLFLGSHFENLIYVLNKIVFYTCWFDFVIQAELSAKMHFEQTGTKLHSKARFIAYNRQYVAIINNK